MAPGWAIMILYTGYLRYENYYQSATPCRSGVAGIEKKGHNGMKWKEKDSR
jgi:hypothetical protein